MNIREKLVASLAPAAMLVASPIAAEARQTGLVTAPDGRINILTDTVLNSTVIGGRTDICWRDASRIDVVYKNQKSIGDQYYIALDWTITDVKTDGETIIVRPNGSTQILDKNGQDRLNRYASLSKKPSSPNAIKAMNVLNATNKMDIATEGQRTKRFANMEQTLCVDLNRWAKTKPYEWNDQRVATRPRVTSAPTVGNRTPK